MRELTVTETEEVGGGFFLLGSLLAAKTLFVGGLISSAIGGLTFLSGNIHHTNNGNNLGKYPYPIYPDTRPY
ncbi:hypothetical protein [Entomobacter blattae]|uniref:Uncharacterized protein n=1 Tax=Entomobacter blattae TaxID=2762277 RepID=A0A7H1NTL2_9PROT|nr:hypothetical protein [Entomobacter blattae]QNT79122.1 hypothetical protein JGUZn3_19080 [Entomobacter blattae]